MADASPEPIPPDDRRRARSAAALQARLRELERRSRRLDELEHARTAFLARLGRELRTPLALALGPLSEALCERAEPLGDRQRWRVEMAARNGRRVLGLVDALIDLARVESGALSARLEATRLGAFTEELARAFEPSFERLSLSLAIDCSALDEPVGVDRALWEKIVDALLSNAAKFTAQGGARLVLRPEGEWIELAVSDTGIGIEPEARARLFEPFGRAEPGAARGSRGALGPRGAQGIGLGLTLVREFARALGGALEIESEPGAGSTFRVRIPRVDASECARRDDGAPRALRLGAERLESAAAAAPPVAGVHVTDPARVLVVDDNPDVQGYVAAVLGREHAVIAVGSAVRAITAVRERRPDLVVADAEMPDLKGEALVRALRSEPHMDGVPILITGTRSGEVRTLAALRAGADDYVPGPFSGEELRARVRNLIASRRLYREVKRHKERAESELARRVQEEERIARERAARRAEILAVLEGGDGLEMLFQPIVDLRTGETLAYEALARFGGAPRRSPDAWFEDAGRLGLGVELELLAVERAARALDRIDPGTRISVNLSPDTLRSPRFAGVMDALPARRFIVELTEHVAVPDYADLAQSLRPAGVAGVQLAVDDAGAGYASLRHILTLRPDIIKLDRTLIASLDTDRARQALVRALVLFADEIGAVVVGEGIEEPSERARLRELGVRYGQGYLLARPTSLAGLDA